MSAFILFAKKRRSHYYLNDDAHKNTQDEGRYPTKRLKRLVPVWVILLAFAMTASCSVMSKDVQKSARKDLEFNTLLKNPESYTGSTVLWGGYILEIRNHPETTEILVLQSPLSFQDEPGPKDASQGRFIVHHKAFLDPEIFSKNRKLTVAGTFVETRTDAVDNHPYPYPIVETKEIYLWPKFEGYRYDPYPYHDPCYPYPFYRDRFHHSPFCW
ncbi:MAG: hypothetical protein COX20_13590 [Desulfobacterales bacterium CG23_combo_of_CG06-09_8_20_14_all_52_9]|nr:MAG: hypothetical protein COX20_13590 [Desulfobacterales bacterium CG23_combo_of_CG06-09_8_20_14_all_52_9]